MKEEEVLKIFNCYKIRLIQKLGTKQTDNEQLEKLGYALLKGRFQGVYPQDKLPVNRSGYYVMNTDTSNKPGIHWVGVVVTKKTVYVWDSFGRKSKTLLKVLTKNAKAVNKVVVDAEYDREQSILSEVCGPLSLAWLLTVKQTGIKNALKV